MLWLYQAPRCLLLAPPGQTVMVGAQETGFAQSPPRVLQILYDDKLGQGGQHSMVPGVDDSSDPISSSKLMALYPAFLSSALRHLYRSSFLSNAAFMRVAVSKGHVSSRRTTWLGVLDLSSRTRSGT